MFANNKRIQLRNDNGCYNVIWIAGLANGKYITNDWQHIAFCYDHANRQGYAFINGESVDDQEYLIKHNMTRQNIEQILLGGYVDELQILEGVCR